MIDSLNFLFAEPVGHRPPNTTQHNQMAALWRICVHTSIVWWARIKNVGLKHCQTESTNSAQYQSSIREPTNCCTEYEKVKQKNKRIRFFVKIKQRRVNRLYETNWRLPNTLYHVHRLHATCVLLPGSLLQETFHRNLLWVCNIGIHNFKTNKANAVFI